MNAQSESAKPGRVVAINGSVITAEFPEQLRQNEVAYARLGDARLKAEVVRMKGRNADLQVFESTAGLRVGDPVEFSGELLSVQLGPGMLGQLYDGLQNPLHRLAGECGFFLKRGIYLNALDEKKAWPFSPMVKPGDVIEAGDTLGTTPEGLVEHRIMAPFSLKGRWRVKEVSDKAPHRVDDIVATVEDEDGRQRALSMTFRWPVKQAVRLYRERLAPTEPLVTQIRLVDALFPVARGGTYCVPGPFGAGKTVLQQLTSRYAKVDIVIIAACGERASEVVETIRDFPDLTDPSTDRPLMERTIIICNTSAMPVAARESSVYTAVTIAEYYRQMGLHVLLLADSTSRWAQAIRERSGRLEEIPGEEAFPAYLESTIAGFYERAGRVRLKDDRIGSVTIGGAVSPAGGNFDEPVTQATLKVVGAFHGLSRERSDARRFPAIDPLESWSRYDGFIERGRRRNMQRFLERAHEVDQMMKVVGEEGTALEDYEVYLKGELFDAVFLQQNGFDPVDAATPQERQTLLFGLLEEILHAPLTLKSRDEARRFFHQLRQHLLDLNGAAWQSDEFEQRMNRVREHTATAINREEAGHMPVLELALVESELDSPIVRQRRMHPGSYQDLRFSEEENEADHN
ncbi:MAG: V-type ATP synthase subunit A [Oceanipulchritudo sp.]